MLKFGQLSSELEKINDRNEELSHIMKHLYENNVVGKITEELFN